MDDEKKRPSKTKEDAAPTVDHPHIGDHAEAHEERDISITVALKWTAGLTVTILVSMIVSRLIMNSFTRGVDHEDRVGTRATYPPQALSTFPAPQLQPHESPDMTTLRNHEDSILNTYGWAEEDAKIARIPIEVAMERLLKKGLPARSADEPSE